MRLLNTATLQTEEFIGSNIPQYAILSHTWEDDEVVLHEYMHPTDTTLKKKGYHKIATTCKLAQRDGHPYAWVDTCCIDKRSSAELTEAINSMFQWYKNAKVCYAYLADLKTDSEDGDLAKCRWFTRGWTLQELIAPDSVLFYDKGWNLRGDKASFSELLERVTGIEESVLQNRRSTSSVPVATRMFWASKRNTTRIEDIAYSLLGIFDVNMPLLYGEGLKAFSRLQREIVRVNSDLTVLGWGRANLPDDIAPQTRFENIGCPILASSPQEFEVNTGVAFVDDAEVSISSVGARLRSPLFVICNKEACEWALCECWDRRHFLQIGQTSLEKETTIYFGLELKQLAPDLFIRTSQKIRTMHERYMSAAAMLEPRTFRLSLDGQSFTSPNLFYPFGKSHRWTPGRARILNSMPQERYNLAEEGWFIDGTPGYLRWGCMDFQMTWEGITFTFSVAIHYTRLELRLFKSPINARDQLALSQLSSTEGYWGWRWLQTFFEGSLNTLRGLEPTGTDWNDFYLQGQRLRLWGKISDRLNFWIEKLE